MRNPFVKPLVRQAILTFDNGSRIRAEVTLVPKRWYTNSDYEATEKKYGNLWNCPFGEEETKWYDEYCTTIYSRKRDLKESFEVYQITDAWEELKTKRII